MPCWQHRCWSPSHFANRLEGPVHIPLTAHTVFHVHETESSGVQARVYTSTSQHQVTLAWISWPADLTWRGNLKCACSLTQPPSLQPALLKAPTLLPSSKGCLGKETDMKSNKQTTHGGCLNAHGRTRCVCVSSAASTGTLFCVMREPCPFLPDKPVWHSWRCTHEPLCAYASNRPCGHCVLCFLGNPWAQMIRAPTCGCFLICLPKMYTLPIHLYRLW